MQTLWSRAARNPSTCRCLLCASKNPAVARRAGIDGVGGAWRVFGTPTSTSVYTAIFTAGLVVDLHAKVRRNREWDAAFAALRDEASTRTLPDTDFEPFTGAESVEEAGPLTGDDTLKGMDWGVISRQAGMVLHDNNARPTEGYANKAAKDLWELIPFDSKFPSRQALEWPANTGRTPNGFAPQSLWSTDALRIESLRRRQTWKKLVFQELAIGVLILQLLESAQTNQLPEESIRSIPQPIQDLARLTPQARRSLRETLSLDIDRINPMPAELAVDAVADIKATLKSTMRPKYYQDMDGDYHMVCEQMNKAVRELLQNPTTVSPQQKAVTIAKICYNLFTSSSAPDVQTFNILITGMKRWRKVDMVDHVIAALYGCYIRPNELTCSAVLDYYINLNQPDKFSHFVKKMRGIDGRALMLARPDVNITENCEGRLIRINENIVIQKVTPTPMVFRTLIRGALKFAGLNRALEIYYDMKNDGWGLDVLGLNHFLLECVRLRDWEAGLYVWEEISSIKASAKEFQMNLVYPVMLSLCAVTQNDGAYTVILREIIKRGCQVKAIIDKVEKVVYKQTKARSTFHPGTTTNGAADAVVSYLDSLSPGTLEAEETGQTDQDVISDSEAILNDLPTVVNIEEEEAKPTAPLDPEDMWRIWLERELGQVSRTRKVATLPPVDNAIPSNADEFLAQHLSAKEKVDGENDNQGGIVKTGDLGHISKVRKVGT
ncbi:hypothetical protein P154DRAFT_429342 [Amniculicola lignicola CBS 123094]|uniref:Pentatricopeptide repeat protein n=1 Tax=Amniculicola lignicola CBS 123094 TaxID=1392246 RepID=A0A6A5WSQ1_9PLEO|nr:hypothetical protein P154DRAFT_429342 [Amniculicola lignicola CBS 123094]